MSEVSSAIDTERHAIEREDYSLRCRQKLEAAGALVLSGFFTDEAIRQVRNESASRSDEAYYASSTHNVYLTLDDPALGPDHPFNRQVASSKGLIADDQIPPDSALRSVYQDRAFRTFLCRVLDIDEIHSYADPLSSINVHFASEGQELGWHFDNSSFAVTMLLQAPEGGGVFEFVPAVRSGASGSPTAEELQRVDDVLNGKAPVLELHFEPGDLVLFRGRDALHRVTPTTGPVTRMLVVLAFNSRPGVALSDSALETFYGRKPGRPH